MLKIEETEVFGFKAAIRGMRNPLNSWDKSDSDGVNVGDNDLGLILRLAKAGRSDRKMLRMVHVQCDVTAPLYWWKEKEQYKVGTTTNSCSTMHKIHSRNLTLDDFSTEHLTEFSLDSLRRTIGDINIYRNSYKLSKDKDEWWQMIQLLPSSYNQKRTLDTNYEVLINVYLQRRHHKLDEWHTFCEWIETLPYMKEILEVVE